MLSWLSLAVVSAAAGFIVGGTFTIQLLVSEMEMFLRIFVEAGS